MNWEQMIAEELERWAQEEKELQQEYARKLGIHQGIIAAYTHLNEKESGLPEEKGGNPE